MNPHRLLIAASASLLLAATVVGCHRHDDGEARRVLSSVSVTPTNPAIANGTSAQFTAIGIYSDGYTSNLTGSAAWDSSDSAVATVSGGLASGSGVGFATISATDVASGVSGSTTLSVTSAVLVSIAVTPTNPSIALGTTRQFTATGTFSDGSTQDVTSSVDFASSDTAVATVSNGLATSSAVGFTTITATDLASGIDGSTTLTVTAAVLVSIAVTPSNPSIALGTSQAFTATGLFSDSTTQDLTGTVDFDSSDAAVAPLSGALASGAAVGFSTITATDVGSGISGSTTLAVTAAALVALAVTPVQPSIALGTDRQFTATGTYSDSTTQDLTDSVTWSSSNVATAVVSNAPGSNGLAVSVAVGLTTVTAADPGSGIDGSTTLTVTAAVLTSIEVTPTSPSIALGTAMQFTATGTFSDDSTQDLTDSVTWSSSNAGAAVVSNAPGGEGLATSVAVGLTTVTATDAASGIHGSTTLTVTAAVLVSIALTPVDPSIALGTTEQFTATGTYSDGSTQDLTGSATFGSSDTAVATLSGGLASGVAVGFCTIVATDPASGIDGSTTLTVTAAVLVSITVTPTNPSIALGTAQQFTATGTYSDASTQDLTSTVTWSSSDPAVAAVSNAPGSAGLAAGLAVGFTGVTATDAASGVDGATTLTVTAAVLVAVAVTPVHPSIALGTTQQFTATGTYSDATTQDLTDTATWSSSTPAYATVSNAPGSRGLATSLAVGSTTVTATDAASGIGGSTTLSVTAAVLTSIAVAPADPAIALGTTQQFTATGTYSDGSTQDLTAAVTWSSSIPAAAAVSNAPGSEGLATSVAVGFTTISATDPASAVGGSTTLTVTAAVLTSIAVTPADPSIALGTTQQFAATGTYSDSTTQDLTGSVTWSSSTPAAATVSNAPGSRGLATSVAVGSTSITATDSASGVSGSTTLGITAAVLTSIAVTPAAPSIVVGSAQQFTATGTYSDASTQDLTSSVTWSSSDTAVATVSNAPASRGLASGIAVGTTTVAATDPASGVFGSTPLGVFADIALRSVSSAGAGSGVLSLAIAQPAGTTAGDVLIASIAVRPSTAVITAPAGWTLVRRTDNASGIANSLAVYRRTAAAGEPASYTWTLSTSTGSVGGIGAFSGVDTASPIDAENGQSTASSLAHATPSVTTTTTRTMLVTAHAFSSSATWTPPAGMAEAVDVACLAVPNSAGMSMECSYALQTAAGATGAKSATASNDADGGNTHILALRRAP